MERLYFRVIGLPLLIALPFLSAGQCVKSAHFKLNLPYCFGSPATFTNLSIGSDSAYSWNFGDPASGAANTSTLTNPNHTFNITGNYNVCLIAYYGYLCGNDTFCTITSSDTIHVNAGHDQDICLGTSAQLNVIAPGATTFSWSPGADLNDSTISNPVASPSTGTVYTVTASDGTCNSTGTVAVNVIPIPHLNPMPNVTICKGSSTTLNASSTNEKGVPNVWSPSTGLSNPNDSSTIASPTVTTTYTVTITVNNSCSGTASVTITVVPAPVITVSNDTTICNGATVNLNATGGVTYSWLPANGLSNANISNPTAAPAATTTYTVTISDGQCSLTATVVINVVQPPDANAGPDLNICIGQSAQLHAIGGTSYLWQPSTGLSDSAVSNPFLNLTDTTTYTYIVTVSNGKICPASMDTVNVTVHPKPAIQAGPDTTIDAGSSVMLIASGTGSTYIWNFNPSLSCTSCPDPLASPTQTTYYYVTTADSFGCSRTDTVLVNVDDEMTVYLPNAFTPGNADNGNEIFFVYGMGIAALDFYIYDRWGEQIFVSHDPTVGWDGTYKGNIVQQDVYVYYVKAISYSAQAVVKTGIVTVVK